MRQNFSRERLGVRRQAERDAALCQAEVSGNLERQQQFESGVAATAVQDAKRFFDHNLENKKPLPFLAEGACDSKSN